nr:related to splicing factor HCC1 [Melanopsichium pennsylvanicum 4]
MYADLEEARARGGHGPSRSSDLDIDRFARRSQTDDDDGSRSREKELAEQLRKRAQASRSANGDDSARGARRSSIASSRSSRRSSPGRSPSRSRSRSRESVRSRRSHHSKKGSSRADQEAEERRKRRRGEDAYRRDRDRDRTVDVDDEERARERRRRRSDRYDDHREIGSAAGSHHRPSPAPSTSRVDRDRYDAYYDDRRHDRGVDRVHRRRNDRHEDDTRSAPRRRGRYDSPATSVRSRRTPSPEIDDYEQRSAFCSQLSSRLGQRDLGEFFEDHLGQGAVQDVRIVMDRVTHRSKGVGYVEFAARELVPKAIELTGKILFGIPIVVQRTDAARHASAYSSAGDAAIRNGIAPHPAVPQLDPRVLASAPLPMQYHTAGAPIHLNAAPPIAPRAPRPGPSMPNSEARLYVGSLHFSLTDENVKAVFEPFGEVEYVDLHREPGTGKSKGFCFIQFKLPEDAKKALEQMNGFELAGRAIRVGNVNAKGTGSGGSYANGAPQSSQGGGHLPQLTSAFDDGGGAGLNPERRAALMEKLARNNEPSPSASSETAAAATQERPAGIPESTSTSLLLKNMFDPAQETETDWDKDLAEDVKDECQAKYGAVTSIHVEKESAGEIYVTFADLDASRKALEGLNGRFFGGKPISAQ